MSVNVIVNHILSFPGFILTEFLLVNVILIFVARQKQQLPVKMTGMTAKALPGLVFLGPSQLILSFLLPLASKI